MRILVVGSGGREHALVWKLMQSPKVDKIYCAPGNPGIGRLAELIDLQVDDIGGLCSFAKEKEIDLTVVGPEVPLVMGIADRFEEEGLRIFAPNRACAQLEGSKAFAKEFMIRHQIPTAKYIECTDVEAARKALGIYGYPMVIKADGLAAGKGVVIAERQEDALKALEEIMEAKVFGAAGDKIVIEEFLTGTEASVLCFVDGTIIKPMVSAQDYKKIFDEDKGPNTGGMGTYSPSHVYDRQLETHVEERILRSIMEGFRKDGLDFKGILFIGLMLTEDGPKVLEFNTRFGDPETQVILTRLETDLIEIMESILENKLEEQEILWCEQKTVCVIVAAGGYPDAYEKGRVISGLDKVDADVIVFHAGTKAHEGQVVTNGGRVLGVTAWGDTVEAAREKAYENVDKIHFEGMYSRKDIGKQLKV
ncbi:MAG: purD [Anaerosolibacter sp.]|jgi:phosphoribosylamine--glycine ligase|uniref:phosphoribosylamine--glycine ligase n=1 Tax=Anaerosolibacter sp. TaxID=1872527 RepID=UPI002637D883|nr:phosphoribosylamine--glycine ligase [Anaerosolibacter sp.]MDF2546698.1 purD [Anaerosolibacter sp.]